MLEMNLKRIREKRKLTQRELAERVNYSQQAVAKWEVGVSSPDASNLIRLCKELNITLGSLLCEQPQGLKEFEVCGLHVALFHVLDQCNTEELLGFDLNRLTETAKIDCAKRIVHFLKQQNDLPFK